MTPPTSTVPGSTPVSGAAAAAADGATTGGSGRGQPAVGRVEPERAQRFREDVAQLRIVEPRARREATLLKLGVLLMVVGVALGVVGYLTSHGTTSPLEQRDGMVIALIGISVSVAGAALFLRYSIAAFLRFWLARLLFEQQSRPAGAFAAPPAEPPTT